MSEVILTSEQDQAVGTAVTAIITGRSYVFGGYAGTGKTMSARTVVKRLEDAGRKGLIMAPTGKAANVLRRKGLVGASTIHRSIYKKEEGSNEWHLIEPHELDHIHYFLIDESSMISTELKDDIEYFGKPIIYMGDPAQLEPAGSDAKIMHKPNIVLKQIHRTAEHSEIIKFATALRTSVIHPFAYRRDTVLPEDSALTFRDNNQIRLSEWMAFDQIIVGRNKTKDAINNALKLNKQGPLPIQGDKVICLKNDYQNDMFNGETYIVNSDEIIPDEDTNEPTIELVDDDGFVSRVPFWLEFFVDSTLDQWKKPRGVVHLDYAYAITCHKSQGSEWGNVAVIDESFGTPPNRWRYTAATRAQNKLTWIPKL